MGIFNTTWGYFSSLARQGARGLARGRAQAMLPPWAAPCLDAKAKEEAGGLISMLQSMGDRCQATMPLGVCPLAPGQVDAFMSAWSASGVDGSFAAMAAIASRDFALASAIGARGDWGMGKLASARHKQIVDRFRESSMPLPSGWEQATIGQALAEFAAVLGYGAPEVYEGFAAQQEALIIGSSCLDPLAPSRRARRL